MNFAARDIQRLVIDFLGALVLVGLCTGIIATVRSVANAGNISIVYLLAVLASAVILGSRSAVVAAVGAFIAYNFFFIQPQRTFTVANQDEWIALLLLLVTGVITGQLAAAMRRRAIEAEGREKEAIILHDVVTLMTEPDLHRALSAVAERVRIELNLAAVVMAFQKNTLANIEVGAGDAEAIKLAYDEAADMVLLQGQHPSGDRRGKPARWIRIVPPSAALLGPRSRTRRVRSVAVDIGNQRMGTIVMVRRPGAPQFSTSDDRLISALARQISVALERLLLRQEATDVEILRRTDELRTALLDAVSHDLRTPLSSIMASAGSLRQRDVQWTEDDRIEFATAIENEAERLSRLVGNLLDLSRIEAGSLRPEKGWYDICGLIREVVGRLRLIASDHRLSVHLDEELPPLHFDYVEIDQVVTNLIENALKYTPLGTEIDVSARVAGDVVLVEVADHGPGIREDAMPHLFEAFYRAPGPDARVNGAGVGLAVARGLVEAHGGAIHVENRSDGGARFRFTLPVDKAILRPNEAAG